MKALALWETMPFSMVLLSRRRLMLCCCGEALRIRDCAVLEGLLLEPQPTAKRNEKATARLNTRERQRELMGSPCAADVSRHHFVSAGAHNLLPRRESSVCNVR